MASTEQDYRRRLEDLLQDMLSFETERNEARDAHKVAKKRYEATEKLLVELIAWEQFMGGFEAPVWDRAKVAVGYRKPTEAP